MKTVVIVIAAALVLGAALTSKPTSGWFWVCWPLVSLLAGIGASFLGDAFND